MAPNQNHPKKKLYPTVSVCTPTFNRRPFIASMLECFRNQTYPKYRIEWIIVDDGTDKIKDLLDAANIPQIKYFPVEKKMALGAKRNFMHEKATGSILVYMDDDDYYPPERIAHAVEKLQEKPEALCAGASEIYIYFKHIHKMVQFGPYGPNHATAGTFAFRRELLNQSRYEDHAALAEEKVFLKNYTIPFVQLDPLKTILVFSHEQNTFDKRKLLDQPHPEFVKESPKTVQEFIRGSADKESAIYNYFMKDIDRLLENYEPGDPKWKPDVLGQIQEIEAERDRMIMEMQKQQGLGAPGAPQIMMQQPGQEPRALTAQEIVSLVQQQQQQIQGLTQQNAELHKIVEEMQKQLLLQTNFPVFPSTQTVPPYVPYSGPLSPKASPSVPLPLQKSKVVPDVPINIAI
jgi:glycosyltransferase involved in cell wall biosynthesis